jgi:uncharacterized protein YajQ (UPF0234 family)
VKNAVNKEIAQRYDLKGTGSTMALEEPVPDHP